MNTNGRPSRGAIQVCARHPEDKNNARVIVSLRCSRERNSVEVQICAVATGCSLYNYPAPRRAISFHWPRKCGIGIVTGLKLLNGDDPGNLELRSAVATLPEEEGQ